MKRSLEFLTFWVVLRNAIDKKKKLELYTVSDSYNTGIPNMFNRREGDTVEKMLL